MEKPYVVVGGFMSIDGKTAPRNRKGVLFTKFMKGNLPKLLHKLRAEVDAIVVGVGTVLADNPRLTVRFVEGKNPVRVVVDSRARTPLTAAVLNVKEAPTILVTSKKASEKKLKALRKMGVETIRCGKNKVNLSEMLRILHKKGIRTILVEGGAELRWGFFKERLVDELFVWVVPVVWGGKNAPTLVDGEGFTSLDKVVQLKLKHMEIVEDVLILKFNVVKQNS